MMTAKMLRDALQDVPDDYLLVVSDFHKFNGKYVRGNHVLGAEVDKEAKQCVIVVREIPWG